MKTKVRSLLAIAVLTVAGAAHADTPPSAWDRAKRPEVSDEFELHQSVQRRLVASGRDDIDAAMRGAVLAMLRAAGAETSKNPLLRFDLGEVYGLLDMHDRAAQVLKAAIAEFPTHSYIERAWFHLAQACGHTGDHECETHAYHEVLRRETEDLHRTTATLNLAETEMHQRDLHEAIEGYREAVRVAGRVENDRTTVILAEYGLAVALDRAGDRIQAEKEARFAVELDRSLGFGRGDAPPSILVTKNVFFVPKYEVAWYLGLGAVASARMATSPRAALVAWERAEHFFALWVDGAEKLKDSEGLHWLPMAKARLAQVKVDLAKARAVVAKLPPQVQEDAKTLRL